MSSRVRLLFHNGRRILAGEAVLRELARSYPAVDWSGRAKWLTAVDLAARYRADFTPNAKLWVFRERRGRLRRSGLYAKLLAAFVRQPQRPRRYLQAQPETTGARKQWMQRLPDEPKLVDSPFVRRVRWKIAKKKGLLKKHATPKRSGSAVTVRDLAGPPPAGYRLLRDEPLQANQNPDIIPLPEWTIDGTRFQINEEAQLRTADGPVVVTGRLVTATE